MSTSTATRLRALPPRADSAPAGRPRLVVASTTPRVTSAPVTVRRVPSAPKDLTRRGVHLTGRGRVLLVLVLAALLLGAFAIGRSASSQASTTASAPAAAPTVVTVLPGDTLWSLAHRLAPGQDTRTVVATLRRLNHLTSANDLKAGQQLLLPAVV